MTDIIIDLRKNFWRREAACRTADLLIQQPDQVRGCDQSQGPAKALGLEIPTTLLARADEVIE